jgi:hypothetical protein
LVALVLFLLVRIISVVQFGLPRQSEENLA